MASAPSAKINGKAAGGCLVAAPGRRQAANRCWLQSSGDASSHGGTPTAAAPLRSTSVPTRRPRTAVRAAEVSVQATEQQRLSLELPTFDVQASVKLMALPQGRGTAIVVAAVEVGSEAAAAGVKPGQQVLSVSDPIRFADTWPLNERANLKYVRQCIRMRRAQTLFLELTAQPIPEWTQAVAAARAAAAAEAAGAQQGAQEQEAGRAAAGANKEEPADLLTAIVQSIDSDDEPSGSSSSRVFKGVGGEAGDSDGDDSELTVAQKLERQYQRQQAAAAEEAVLVRQQMTALQQRQKRRRDYLEQQSQRNDGPFFAGVAALFLLPPAAILAWAFASGYIDQLDTYGMLR